MVEEVSARLLARLNVPPQESLLHTRNVLRQMIMRDPSLREVINNLIEEICSELEQEDSDCKMYSISSQIGTEEQGICKLSYNIDLEDILNEKSHSERPTPHAKREEIAEYI